MSIRFDELIATNSIEEVPGVGVGVGVGAGADMTTLCSRIAFYRIPFNRPTCRSLKLCSVSPRKSLADSEVLSKDTLCFSIVASQTWSSIHFTQKKQHYVHEDINELLFTTEAGIYLLNFLYSPHQYTSNQKSGFLPKYLSYLRFIRDFTYPIGENESRCAVASCG